MSDAIKGGGPAYPPSVNAVGDEGPDGMSLRDYFAGQALAGISSILSEGFSLPPEDEARWAYERADAMLAERGTPEARA